ncbi:hypothetical protein LAM67_25455, partial [Mycobacterium tuberculosis]|nr:hypothetical protein [Mycobacterium tuberculosis]
AANDQQLIFARTHTGEVWKIGLWRFNKKTVTLNDSRTPPHGGKQRLKYEELESLGTCSIINTDDGDDGEDQAGTVEATVAETEPARHA